jgi:hypothetical protein
VTSPSVSPRHGQIDFLTRGLDLPFAALLDEHLSVIAEILAGAWSDLLQSHPTTLLTGAEAEINALMETRLGQLLDDHPLWEQMVRCVTRGKETLSYDGSHLEKRPDISIHLTARNQAFPLIVECKLIDAPNRKGPDLYCENGLKRFLTGEYGWATQEAFMMAYVRDGTSIASALSPFLARTTSRNPQPYLVEDMPVAVATMGYDLARSRHARPFQYPTRTPPRDVPGAVTLWHLWVPTAAPATGSATTIAFGPN